MSPSSPQSWLPPGKQAAVCFSIDDVHPARATDPYEAGGDLGRGALRHLEWLLSRHPHLRATLFVTADWREISPVVSRRLLARIPGLRDRVYLAPRWPKGTMRVDLHPEFCNYLKSLPRTEVALHGLHHVHPGPRIHVEFQQETRAACAHRLGDALDIFERAGMERPAGMTPPGFEAPPELLAAMCDLQFEYVASARDIRTDITPHARATMTGLRGVSLLYPERLPGGLVHIPVNFQATCAPERARAILTQGGVLHIKAHIIKDCLGFIALDGLDDLYRNYLDLLFADLHQRFGASLWWASLKEVAAAVRNGVSDAGEVA
jgi:hypothetical protein